MNLKRLLTWSIIIFCGAWISALFFYPQIIHAASSILIYEVSIGNTTNNDADYIKLINAGSEVINLKGFRLIKRSKSSTTDTSIKSFTANTLLNPGAFLTWANSSLAASADITTSQTLSKDNCIALRQGAENTGEIVDSLAWGECTQLAKTEATCNPASGESIKRIDSQNTDNNKTDFLVNCEIITPATSTQSVNAEIISSGGSGSTVVAEEEIIIKEPVVKTADKSPLEFTEILPDPVGSDESPKTEFIEIYNNSDKDINLKNYYLTNSNNQIFKFADSKILAKNYLALYRQDTNFKLNNTSGEIKLYSDTGKNLAKISYKNAIQGSSWMRNQAAQITDSDWVWTLKATPSAVNEILLLNNKPKAVLICPAASTDPGAIWLDASDSYDTDNNDLKYVWSLDNKNISTNPDIEIYLSSGNHEIKLSVSDNMLNDEIICKTKTSGAIIPAKIIKPIIKKPIIKTKNATIKKATVNKIKTINKKPTIKTVAAAKISDNSVTGKVFSLPGQLASQYFYVLPDTGGPAWQIYKFDKKFPSLKIGQIVSITARRSEQKSEPRLLLDKPEQIKIINNQENLQAQIKNIKDISTSSIGQFVKINGKYLNKQNNILFISDNTGELGVVIPSSAKMPVLKTGDLLSVQGLVKAGEPMKLAVRYAADIQIATAQVVPQAASNNLVLPQAPTQQNNYYWLGIVGFALIVGGAWMFRNKKK